MARPIVVLALVLIVLVGLVSADSTTDTDPSPAGLGGSEAAAAVDDDAIGNTDDDSIGNTDDDSIRNTDEAAGAPSKSTDGGDAAVAAVEGPIGSEEAAKNFAGAAQPTSSGATTYGFSAVAGAAAIAGYFFF